LVDRDDDDCDELKSRLEDAAARVGLASRSSRVRDWRVVNRLAIEELEAWYFGSWEAVRAVYPRVEANVPGQRAFRDPDAITGGTWEAFERLLQRRGYMKGGLGKIAAARAIGSRLEPTTSRSRSFQVFHRAVLEAVS
jgi:hypothetical protein